MPPTAEVRHVDLRIWRACAGSSVRILIVNSRVYYFPEGHVEQSCGSAPLLSSLVLSRPAIACVISDVHCLADPITDEVFVKLFLVPVGPSRLPNQFLDINDEVEDSDKIVSFAKILTPSDANNGGGFSVPRFCADSIFPPLDYNADPPVQTLSATDVRGGTWEFRHIYRGTPRRHLLTTGWSKFVNQKKLIAGDSVVFMRDGNGKMFIGVRRAMKKGEDGGDSGRWREPSDGGAMKGEGRGRMTSEAVAEAAERAAKGLPFEVVYYPRPGWTDFVVRAELVEAGLSIYWSAGTRVKMAIETDDSSRMSCFQGTVISAASLDTGPWIPSPWRMLCCDAWLKCILWYSLCHPMLLSGEQVAWDDPDVLQNARRVSPWQIEIASSLPLHSSFPLAKKSRLSQEFGLADSEGEIFFPITGLTNSTMRYTNPSLLNYNCFPAGMQGARQNHFHVQGSTNYVSENTPMMSTDSFSSNYLLPKLNRISTESNNLSPDSQSSMVSFGTEFTENVCCSSSKDRLDVQCERASAFKGFSL
ncbi:auxin response factor 17 [Hibiscus trionum]|uniref:Auxin response factor n=1 Tax=Hibiscus trionum TaxID=183268 RepID=A0A9W7LU00_HIBTR|nr:auxin response factor 17 [Hibiscus trionum]